MGVIGARAVAHFGKLSHRVIEVPEWGESLEAPLVIHAKPMSVLDATAIFDAGAKSNFDMFVVALIRLAEDANGKPLFDLSDKPLLRRAAREVVERVGSELLKSRSGDELMEPFEAVVKN